MENWLSLLVSGLGTWQGRDTQVIESNTKRWKAAEASLCWPAAIQRAHDEREGGADTTTALGVHSAVGVAASRAPAAPNMMTA